MHITKWKTIRKGYLLYDSKYVTFWKGQNYGDSQRITGYQEVGEREGWKGRAQKIFRAVKLFYTII